MRTLHAIHSSFFSTCRKKIHVSRLWPPWTRSVPPSSLRGEERAGHPRPAATGKAFAHARSVTWSFAHAQCYCHVVNSCFYCVHYAIKSACQPAFLAAFVLPTSSIKSTMQRTVSRDSHVQLVPEDIWQNYLLRFEAEEGCGFQECEVEDTEHFHCKDEGCETVFRYRVFFSRMRSSNLGENCVFQAKLKRAFSVLISLHKPPSLRH